MTSNGKETIVFFIVVDAGDEPKFTSMNLGDINFNFSFIADQLKIQFL